MNTRRYVKKIIVIIILTSIPFIGLLFAKPPIGIGWLLGALASCFNFLVMAKSATDVINFATSEKASKFKTIKGFYLRYGIIVLYAVLVVKFIKPDIISFGIGLLAAQIAIYLELFFKTLTSGSWISYFRR